MCTHCTKGKESSFERHVRAAKSSTESMLNKQVYSAGFGSGQKCIVNTACVILTQITFIVDMWGLQKVTPFILLRDELLLRQIFSM